MDKPDVRPAAILRLLFKPVEVKLRRFEGGNLALIVKTFVEIHRHEAGACADVQAFPMRLNVQPVKEPVCDTAPDAVLEPEAFEFSLIYT